MRIVIPLVVLLLLIAAGADGQTPALINPAGAAAGETEAALPANAKIDEILDALDQRGELMRDFTAKVSMETGDRFIGDESTKFGKVWFQKDDHGGHIHVLFEKRKDSRGMLNEKIEYLLQDGWLTDRDYRKHTESRRQVSKPGDKVNLLKLGEGAFPLPIGQKKEDVHQLFDVSTFAPEKNERKDLADTLRIRLTPKDRTPFKKRFGKIDVWVSRIARFPVQISTVAPDDSDQHVTRLEDLQVNPPGGLHQQDFDLDKSIDLNSWILHTEPYRE